MFASDLHKLMRMNRT